MKITLLNSLIFIAILCLSAFHFAYAQQGSVVINQDKDISSLLDAKKELNKDSNDYYKIQIYSGNRNSAESAKSNFHSKFSAWPCRIKYEAPNFKIWAGNFRTRLEADRALKQIKTEFPNAFIFKPRN